MQLGLLFPQINTINIKNMRILHIIPFISITKDSLYYIFHY